MASRYEGSTAFLSPNKKTPRTQRAEQSHTHIREESQTVDPEQPRTQNQRSEPGRQGRAGQGRGEDDERGVKSTRKEAMPYLFLSRYADLAHLPRRLKDLAE